MDHIDRILEELETLRLPELCVRWTSEFGELSPATRSAEWLRHLLAWKLQETVDGGIPAKTRKQLARLANAFEKDDRFTPAANLELAPGTLISREWKGVRHQVRVLPEGFEYAELRYGNLSEVARAITGTRWSGPRFFGLETSRASQECS